LILSKFFAPLAALFWPLLAYFTINSVDSAFIAEQRPRSREF
jgi:hypothetical protein